jgi:NADPH:quinone reductase-like Zn-dependent oxidoreductase
VLVHAAAGGVGHVAVQIAKARGAYVIGTASAGKHAFVRGLGADEVIDYTTTDFAETLRDVDVVLDTVGGEYGTRSLRTMRPGGVLVAIVFAQRDQVRALGQELGIRVEHLTVEADHAGMKALADLVQRGLLRVEIDDVLPLEKAGEAHRRAEAGRTRGKVVLRVD